MKINFYKIRALTFYFFVKIIGAVLFIKVPPIASAAAFIKKDNKYLFIKLSYYDGYALPGGRIERFESSEEAVKREILEETGLIANKIEYLGSVGVLSKGLAGLSMIYKAETTGEIKDSGEGKPEWLTIEEVKNKLVYQTNIEAIEKFLI